MLVTPRNLALLIERLQVLFGRPAMLSEGRGIAATIASEALPVDVLKEIVVLTRGLANTPAHGCIAPAPTAPSAR